MVYFEAWAKMASAADIEKRALELLSSEESKQAFVHLLLQGLGQEELSILARQLLFSYPDSESDAESGDDSFSRRIGVREYSEDEQASLELASLVQMFAYRKRLLQDSLSASQVAKMLGVSRQTPHDRVKAGLLLGVLDNNVMKFPAWQFDASGPNGVVQGLPEVLAALNCGAFAQISWLASPNNNFDGLRPIEALKKGLVAEVLHEAQAVGAS